MRFLLAALLAGCLAGFATAQTPIARFIYEDAEAAFAQGDHALALTRLAEAEREFGKLNPPILYLRIQARHALFKAKAAEPVDFDLLDPLRRDVQRYLKDYGGMAVLVDQVREIYQLSRELERYPADRAAYEAQLAAQQRAAEQQRQAEEARRQAELARLSEPGRTFRDCPQCPEMVVVPGGKLMVQAQGGPREIEIQPFAISRHELTWEQWYVLRGEQVPPQLHCKNCPVEDRLYSPHGPAGNEDRDVWRLLRALSKQTGQNYHLPSEAQWEWACRGGEPHRYCGGDNLAEVAWFDKGFTGAQPVGTKKPNGYGLYDMSGNAYDGTGDSFFADYDPPADGGPRFAGDLRNNRVVTRGGRALMSNQKAFEVGTRGNQAIGVRLAHPLQGGLIGINYRAVEANKPRGVKVDSVVAGSPAERAGVQVGDEIVQVDGRPILTDWSMLAYMSTVPAGRMVRLALLRNGERLILDVTAAPRQLHP